MHSLSPLACALASSLGPYERMCSFRQVGVGGAQQAFSTMIVAQTNTPDSSKIPPQFCRPPPGCVTCEHACRYCCGGTLLWPRLWPRPRRYSQNSSMGEYCYAHTHAHGMGIMTPLAMAICTRGRGHSFGLLWPWPWPWLCLWPHIPTRICPVDGVMLAYS